MSVREMASAPSAGGIQFAGMGFGSGSGGGGGSYTLPTATASRLGGVKIGNGINVSSDGTISASGGGGGGGSFDYSTTEFNTGQKWIDGKDIYGITVVYTLPTSNGEFAIATINNVDTFVGVVGTMQSPTKVNTSCLPDRSTELSFRNDANEFRVNKQNTALNNWKLYATGFYTKNV